MGNSRKEVGAFFDFDGTLISRQSLFLYFSFLNFTTHSISYKLYYLLLRFLSKFFHKRFKIKAFTFGIRFLSKRELISLSELFAKYIFINFINKAVFKRLISHNFSGHRVIIVTAALDIYVKYFFSHIPIFSIISTKVEEAADNFTGFMVGDYCIGEVKVKELFKTKYINEIDLSNSFFYTDSKEDLPFTKIIGNNYLVNYRGQVIPNE